VLPTELGPFCSPIPETRTRPTINRLRKDRRIIITPLTVIQRITAAGTSAAGIMVDSMAADITVAVLTEEARVAGIIDLNAARPATGLVG
jgi:hypothetical protein